MSHCAIGLFVCLLALAATQADSAPLYQVTELGDLGGGTTIARAINASGQVVGYSTLANGEQHAFSFVAGMMTDLNPSSSFSDAWGINASGQIVGQSSFAGQSSLNAAKFAGGSATDLGTFGQASAIAVGIADNGDLAVRATTAVGGGSSAFRSFYVSGNTSTDIGTLGSQFSFAYAMGANGTIVGGSGVQPGGVVNDHYHPFAYTTAGGIVDLGIFGGTNGTAFAVNSHGDVGGISDNISGTGQTAFIYSADSLNPLPGLVGFGANGVFGMNSLGDEVGSVGTGNITRAVLYADGSAFDLNNLINPTDALFDSIVLTDAVAVNDSGQILALGCDIGEDCSHSIYINGCGANTHCHSYLLTESQVDNSAPEPATLPLVSLCIAGIWSMRRRTKPVKPRRDGPRLSGLQPKVIGAPCLAT